MQQAAQLMSAAPGASSHSNNISSMFLMQFCFANALFFPPRACSFFPFDTSPAPSRAQLFSRRTQALMFNFKPEPVQRMLDFDYMCGKDIKEASLAGLITPGSSRGNHKVRISIKEVVVKSCLHFMPQGLLRDG